MSKYGNGPLLTRLALSLALAAVAGYFFLGRAVVLLFYEGKPPLADRFLRHAHLFPLDYYQEKADAAFLRFALFATILFAAAHVFCRKR